MICRLAAWVAVTFILATVSTPMSRGQAPASAIPLFDNLGDHHYAITTSVPQAQRYFDQGLRLYYAFNHAESIRAFEQAARLDDRCAMCYWGIALAYGPNINAPMDRNGGLAAYEALQKALAREAQASPTERAFIQALTKRYAKEPPEDRGALDAAYADAMREVVRRFPADLEAATLLAESLMDLSPWNYWAPDGAPRPATPEILSNLERVMAADSSHPGGNHFYIHAVEAVQPARALDAAERLAGLMPGAGHLVHMPGHIYIRVGRFLDAIAANEHAVHADETYIRDHRPAMGTYTAGYYPHNYDFLAFAASLAGRRQQATAAAEKVNALMPVELLREPGMSFGQHHHTRHLQMKLRFALWDDILKVPSPPADLPYAAALWNYARGRALAVRGEAQEAEKSLANIRATASDEKVAALRLEFNVAGAVLSLAADALAGHIAAARGDWAAAIAHLREAQRREDLLTYGEPPEWSIPVRQELGVMLLRAGKPAEAAQAFREDLRKFPDNGWSLRGLELALRATGSAEEADQVSATFRKSWAAADVPVANLDSVMGISTR